MCDSEDTIFWLNSSPPGEVRMACDRHRTHQQDSSFFFSVMFVDHGEQLTKEKRVYLRAVKLGNASPFSELELGASHMSAM